MQNKEPAHSLFRNARREAWIVALVWALAFAWTVVWCYIHGYAHDEIGWGEAEPTPDLVLGFPDWVFWGIIFPWLACSAFTIWFGIWGMTDDDLGREQEMGGGDAHGH